MELGDSGDQRIGAVGGGLEDGGGLGRRFDRALPVVDAVARGENVDAGGEVGLDDGKADPLGLLGVGEDGVDGDHAQGQRPTT